MAIGIISGASLITLYFGTYETGEVLGTNVPTLLSLLIVIVSDKLFLNRIDRNNLISRLSNSRTGDREREYIVGKILRWDYKKIGFNIHKICGKYSKDIIFTVKLFLYMAYIFNLLGIIRNVLFMVTVNINAYAVLQTILCVMTILVIDTQIVTVVIIKKAFNKYREEIKNVNS